MKGLWRRLRGPLRIGLTGPLGALFAAGSVATARRGVVGDVTSGLDDGVA